MALEDNIRKELEYLKIDAKVSAIGLPLIDDPNVYREMIRVTFNTPEEMNLYKLTGYHSDIPWVIFQLKQENNIVKN